MPLAALAVVLTAVLAALLFTLRGGRGVQDAARGGPGLAASPADAPAIDLAATADPAEEAADEPATTSAEDEVQAEQDEPEREAPPSAAPSRERDEGPGRARVRGRVLPAMPGVVVLAGTRGVLPLDAQAVGSPAGLDDPPPPAVRRTQTRQDGSFALTGVEPGPLRLALRAPGFAPLDLEGLWLLAGEDLDLGNVVLPEGVVVEGRAVDEVGAPVADVRVLAPPQRFPGAREALGVRACSPLFDEEGAGRFAVVVPPGAWELLVTAPDRLPERVRGFGSPGAVASGLEVVLPLASLLSGELIDLDGIAEEPVGIGSFSLARPLVEVEAARAAGIPPQALAGWRTTTTDGARRFQLRGLAPGEAVLLHALAGEPYDVHDAFAPLALATAGDAKVELFLLAPSTLAFEVVDATTLSPLQPFLVRLPAVLPRALDGSLRYASPARLEGLRPQSRAADPVFEDLPESVDLTLTLEAEGYDTFESRPFRLRRGEATELGRLALQPLPSLHVRVLDDASGTPVAGADCELACVAPERAVGRASSLAESDAEGRARLTVLASNAAELMVRRRGYAPWRGRLPRFTSPEAPLEVRLVRGGTLRVRALDARRNPLRAEVLRARAGSELRPDRVPSHEVARVDADGWAVFEDLEPGLWSVAGRMLARSDLDVAVDPGLLSWVAVGVSSGGVTETEVPVALVVDVRLHLTLGKRKLPFARVWLAPGADGFTRPYDDARGLAAWPTAVCDERGECAFGGLVPGVWSLRVEHHELSAPLRWPFLAEPGTPFVGVDLASTVLTGSVVDEQGEGIEAAVELWAHAGSWYDGLDVGPGASLDAIAPERSVFARTFAGSGEFVLRGVPPGVELVLSGDTLGRRGDSFVEPLEPGEVRTGVVLTLSRGVTEVYVWPDLEGLPERPRRGALGVIGLCLDQPWGLGVLAERLDASGRLRRHERVTLPQGRWRFQLVELVSGHVVLRTGQWFEYDELPDRYGLRLPWVAR